MNTLPEFERELEALVNKTVEEYGEAAIPTIASLLSSKGAKLYISLGGKIEIDNPNKLESFIAKEN